MLSAVALLRRQRPDDTQIQPQTPRPALKGEEKGASKRWGGVQGRTAHMVVHELGLRAVLETKLMYHHVKGIEACSAIP